MKDLKILIVDDDPVWQETLGVFLEIEFGVTPTLLPTGRDVLNHIQTEPVDLIFTDTNMPLLHGINLLKAVKNKNAQIKVVVFFNGLNGSDISKQEVLDLGADGVLRKEDASQLLPAIIKSIIP